MKYTTKEIVRTLNRELDFNQADTLYKTLGREANNQSASFIVNSQFKINVIMNTVRATVYVSDNGSDVSPVNYQDNQDIINADLYRSFKLTAITKGYQFLLYREQSRVTTLARKLLRVVNKAQEQVKSTDESSARVDTKLNPVGRGFLEDALDDVLTDVYIRHEHNHAELKLGRAINGLLDKGNTLYKVSQIYLEPRDVIKNYLSTGVVEIVPD